MQQLMMVSNEKHLLTGGKDGMVYVRDLAKLDSLFKLQVHSLPQGGVSALSINKDSSVLSVGGFDGTVFLYNLNRAYEYESNTIIK